MNKLFFLILFSISILITDFLSGQSIYITKLNDLNFGDVFIGYSKDVPHTDFNAAKFRFYHTATARKTIYISFTLPGSLSNGLDNIPIIFDQSHTAWSYTDKTSGRTNFNPYSRYAINNVRANRYIYLWVGAYLPASPGVSFGLYEGTIILTVEY